MERYQKILLWVLSYLPLYLLCFLKYFDEDIFEYVSQISKLGDLGIFILILLATVCLFLILKRPGELYLSFVLKKISSEENYGQLDTYEVRKIERISSGHVNFFLISIFLPLVALDMDSRLDIISFILILSLLVSVSISSQMLIVNPLLLFSKKFKIFEAELSSDSRENETSNSRFSAIIVVKDGEWSLNSEMKGFQLEGRNLIYLKD